MLFSPQFEENAHGGSSAIGTFVSADRKGGGGNNFGGVSTVNTVALNQEITFGHLCTETLFAGAFNTGVGRESREITLKNARKKIQALAQQLRLRPDHIDMVRLLKKTNNYKKNHIDMARISLQ